MTVVSEELMRSLASNEFYQHVGFELLHAQDEEVLLKLPIKEDLLNTNKTLHGGVHASMLDMVQNILLRTVYQAKPVVMNQDVHYFAPANQGDLLAKGRIIQKGYKLATVEAEITDQQGLLIAKGTGVYKMIR